jgi:hypothetical protein
VEPNHIRFGGGAAETILHPLIAVWMLIAIVLILVVSRKNVISPFLLAFFTIPLGQLIVIGGLHFPVLRILILAGIVRIIISPKTESEGIFPLGFKAIDRWVVLWTTFALIIVSLQWMELPAFVKYAGDFLDTLGGYLVVRFFIPDRDAVRRAIKVLAVVCVIHGAGMINEHFTQKDIFNYLGGVGIDAEVRDGHVRAGGLLGTIQSGTFGGVLVPLFIWLWTEKKARIAAFAGFAGATAMVVMSYSSTSFLAYASCLLALAFWPLRGWMKWVRWGLVAVLVGLHLVMKGPVWSIIEHIDVANGSSSFHRYMLIDTFIRHFGDWWLLGTRSNGSWGWEMWDTCNQFVAVGLTGGLLSLIAYIAVLKRSFAELGDALKRSRESKPEQWFLWCLGSSLFANVVAQFGINYMIQLQMILFPLLACICIATAQTVPALVKSPVLGELTPAPSSPGATLRLS